jgi:predicted dinucleotide-binding enzyme
MQIAVIGMGNVGKALGRRWAEARHAITFCVRNPNDSNKRALAQSMQATISSVPSAANCEVVLLAIPCRPVPDALRAPGNLAGKVLLDCTNPVNEDLTALTLGHTTSSGEEVARLVPQARVVKIFNTNGSKNIEDPDYGGHKVTMLYAGDDLSANQLSARLTSGIGFEPIEMGGLKQARLPEPLAMAWIILARHRGLGRDFALDVVHRPAR